jgi:hypothetical protein
MVVGTLAIFLLLFTVSLNVHDEVSKGEWKGAPELEITNATLILISAAGAVAALVAQRDFSALAARFVASIRALVTATLGLPVVVAGILIYGKRSATVLTGVTTERLLWVVTAMAALTFGFTLVAWCGSWVSERRRLIWESPWDMTTFQDASPPKLHRLVARRDFLDALTVGRFYTAAVGVASAEGWHRIYAWDDAKQVEAVNHLEEMRFDLDALPARTPACMSFPSTCQARPSLCPTHSFRRDVDT